MAKRIITKIGDIFCAPFVRICYPNGLNISICNALNRQNKRKVFGDYKSLYSKRSDNISARTGTIRTIIQNA